MAPGDGGRMSALAYIAAAGLAAASPGFSDPGRIDNRYLPLSKFTRCEYRGLHEHNVTRRLRRTRAFRVEGQRVEAVVIEDRAFEEGRLVERTLDYYAQGDDGTVYYLGEHVSNIRRGRVVSHRGSWLYGKHTDVLGVAMPSNPVLGAQWRFEDVPGITVESDRVEEVGMRARVRAGGRLFTDVIRVQEFIQPEGDVEYKLYAPGTGLIAEYPPGGGRVVLRGCRRPS
jgi:hypothetical protein